MTSYLFSTLMLLQFVSKKNDPNLLYLVGPGIRAIALQIDLLVDSRLSKNMMATARMFHKSERKQKRPQVIEPHVGIAPTPQNLFEGLFVPVGRC